LKFEREDGMANKKEQQDPQLETGATEETAAAVLTSVVEESAPSAPEVAVPKVLVELHGEYLGLLAPCPYCGRGHILDSALADEDLPVAAPCAEARGGKITLTVLTAAAAELPAGKEK
jgi:hypothetical protein